MAPQLQLNSGPQDALLYDNTRSYFTNVGYVRTSNFQMELRDIDPQNTASLGGTVNFAAWKSNFENNLALGERLKRFEIFLRETL